MIKTIFKTILIIISILLFITGIYFILKHQAATSIITGTLTHCLYVTDDVKSVAKFDPYSICTFTYIVDGHTYNDIQISNPNVKWKDGDKLQVTYDPTNPQDVNYYPTQYKNLGILCFVFMGILLFILVLFFRK